MDDRDAYQRHLKARLPHTWDALFARFGRFTEIQTQAIPPLLEGHNCVLVSATASGKTEAALAPLLETLKQNLKPLRQLSILYIVPTRALARDLARRLQQPLEKLALTVQVKTGDEPALNSSRPPALLITTPESFDSLLANHPRMLKDLRAVVIDELHIFDNTARGDQLRILLNRLRRLKRYALSRGDITNEALQYCALSATIHDPASVAARYFNDPLVIQVAGQRALDAGLVELESVATLHSLFAELKSRGIKKVLAFCQSRAECEQWAFEMRNGTPFGDRVFVHHASLDAKVRRHAETQFAQSEVALCFATSTLELGIDIGDVDLIVLIGAPGNLSAFLQRIGRGNRRTARTSVICCHRNETERVLLQIYVAAAQAGEIIEPSNYFFRPSIVVQQLCSYVKQTKYGEIDLNHAFGLFANLHGAPLLPKAQYDQIIEHLTLKNYFVATTNGLLKPGAAWSELFEQRAIYTNLLDLTRVTIDVIDEETGRKLGEVERAVQPGGTFLFGGHARQSARVSGRKLMVREASQTSNSSLPHRRSAWRPMTPTLAQAVAKILGAPQAKTPHDIAFVTEPAENDAERAVTWVFHCSGEAYGLLLGDVLEMLYCVRVKDYNDLYLAVNGIVPSGQLNFTGAQVQACLRRRWKQMESWFELGRFQDQLPIEARRASVNAAFDEANFVLQFQGRSLTTVLAPLEESSEP
ncbi:MAG: DEAD/DEAH box helicase [Acidobacteria bacterium]|nr:DEAD/DEAH box helicase [Acidobacteriota bacterium]